MIREESDIKWNVNEREITPPSTAFQSKERYIDYHNIQGAILACASILFALLAIYFTTQKSEEIKAAVISNAAVTSGPVNALEMEKLQSLAQTLSAQMKDKTWFQDLQVSEHGYLVLVLNPAGLFQKGTGAASEFYTDYMVETEREFLDGLLVRHFLSDPTWNFVVAGHTDHTKIENLNKDRFKSNWEVGAARASAVARLLEQAGFYHRQIRIVSLADTKPLLPIKDLQNKEIPENIAKNQRVELLIGKQMNALLVHH